LEPQYTRRNISIKYFFLAWSNLMSTHWVAGPRSPMDRDDNGSSSGQVVQKPNPQWNRAKWKITPLFTGEISDSHGAPRVYINGSSNIYPTCGVHPQSSPPALSLSLSPSPSWRDIRSPRSPTSVAHSAGNTRGGYSTWSGVVVDASRRWDTLFHNAGHVTGKGGDTPIPWQTREVKLQLLRWIDIWSSSSSGSGVAIQVVELDSGGEAGEKIYEEE
jgi:hypothetical protein